MNRSNVRQVLDCAGPLALSDPARARESGRGLPQSKTLSRDATVRDEFIVPRHAKKLTAVRGQKAMKVISPPPSAHAPAETPSGH